jgi:hypothetical protein
MWVLRKLSSHFQVSIWHECQSILRDKLYVALVVGSSTNRCEVRCVSVPLRATDWRRYQCFAVAALA